MGKKGVPMTVVMQGMGGTTDATGLLRDDDGKLVNGPVGSMFYSNGVPTMTASAFNAGQATDEF